MVSVAFIIFFLIFALMHLYFLSRHTGYKMNKCVGAIEEFQFLPLSSGKHLHLTIAVTGWLCSGKYSMYCFCCLPTTTYRTLTKLWQNG